YLHAGLRPPVRCQPSSGLAAATRCIPRNGPTAWGERRLVPRPGTRRPGPSETRSEKELAPETNGWFAARVLPQKRVHMFYLGEAVTGCGDGWLDADI